MRRADFFLKKKENDVEKEKEKEKKKYIGVFYLINKHWIMSGFH